jgi:broad specificity phosphatase PhoE
VSNPDDLQLDWEPQPFPHLRHPSAGDTVLYLVRHGQTAANLQRLLQGSSDHPLDDLGVRQANLIADRLASLPPVDAIVSSPLQRALVTATIIGDRLGLEPRVIPDLSELNFGDWENRKFEEMVAAHPDIAARMLDTDDHDIGWPGGETRRDFNERVRQAFAEILGEYHAHRVIVVAHGGVLGAFLAMVQGLSPNDPTHYDIKNCSLSELRVTTEHTVIQLRNDACHLDPLVEVEVAEESEA